MDPRLDQSPACATVRRSGFVGHKMTRAPRLCCGCFVLYTCRIGSQTSHRQHQNKPIRRATHRHRHRSDGGRVAVQQKDEGA